MGIDVPDADLLLAKLLSLRPTVSLSLSLSPPVSHIRPPQPDELRAVVSKSGAATIEPDPRLQIWPTARNLGGGGDAAAGFLNFLHHRASSRHRNLQIWLLPSATPTPPSSVQIWRRVMEYVPFDLKRSVDSKSQPWRR